MPAGAALEQSFQELFPGEVKLTVSSAAERIVICTLGQQADDFTAAITLVEQPVPWQQLEGPCETARYWPEAVATLKDHQAHLMVTLIDEGTKSLDKSIALTQLVAATVAASESATGVFWGPGRLVHPRDGFLGQAEQVQPENLPLFLWIDFRVEKVEADGTETVRLYTTGLEALGQTEIEVDQFNGTPQELLEYAYNIAHYLLIGSKAVEDSHTIGLTDELQAVVTRGPSFLDPELEVLQLRLEVPTE
ncbi:hypothetical protein HG15A2_33560 [Adhaeretor mobilis]|uniref:DUF4261 domain-containing protein n=2 Tax=Adhaeretor mobilis TaxID=1930276 RepID=A0A517MYQ5_9BACT|nr:hypothetical protein HG15A2_33560 [Adhaeretor mobilis]